MSDTQFTPPPIGNTSSGNNENTNFNSNSKAAFSDDYNPLDEPVNEKPYSQPNFSASAESLNQEIPQPTYTAPPIGKEDAYKDINRDNAGSSGIGGQQTVNPSLNEVPNEDKKMAAKHLTNLIIDGYEQIHVFANHSLKFSERKINKLVQDGEINLNAPIVYDYGSTITGGEFIRAFNEQTKDTFVVSDDFKKEAKPILQKVLEKRGAGLTDEQYLIYLFGKDIALKTVTFVQIKQQMKDVIDTMKEYTEAYKQNNAPQGQPASFEPTSPSSSPSSSKTYTDSTYSSSYSEPEEETIIPPDFGNPESMDLINKGEQDANRARQNSNKKKRQSHHFSGKKRGRPKKNDDISDAIIIDEDNPLD